jgi:putative restriction endonuclease
MRYWWVNQNKTYQQEVGGGYVWSPKRKANGNINPFYETMREVAPGDIVLSFAETLIGAIGTARSHCYECPKPKEFGAAGMNWADVGWKVEISFVELRRPVRPVDHMQMILPRLPARYSPLLPNGKGSQSVYLAEIPEPLFHVLSQLIGDEAKETMRVAEGWSEPAAADDASARDQLAWEDYVRQSVENDATLRDTERQAVIQARRGQGLFRQRVSLVETRCRVTGVSNPEHLRASHCKPWRDSSNEERLNGENGLLLTPSIDHLFDRGFIGFDGNGALLISPVADVLSLRRMGIRPDERTDVGAFAQGQRMYLDWHREYVFLQSKRPTARN